EAAVRLVAERETIEQKSWFETTLSSIGDGVIATDIEGAVRFMNGVARRMTGWEEAASLGVPLEEVFRIVNETTLQKVDNPVKQVLAGGKIVGLANHTLLLSRDGSRTPIVDSAAPIRDG